MVEELSLETLACLILVTAFILLSVTLNTYSDKYLILKLVHESGICILLGTLTAAITYWATGDTPAKFEASLFFQFMLPFLIFGVGYNMKRRRFFRNIIPILINGFIGTILNFILLSTFAWVFSNSDSITDSLGGFHKINLRDSLAIGAVLSAPETVVTLSILKENKHPRLNSIMFGESIIGTAISIILTTTITQTDISELDTLSVFYFIGYFCYNLFFSVVLGIAMGFISSLMTKNFSAIKSSPNKEVALQFYIAWTGYIIASMFSLSGVITILICAIISSHYAYYNMKPDSRIVVGDTFYLIGDGTRALIFAYLGLTSLSYSTGSISLLYMFFMLISIIVVRFITVFGLTFIASLMTKKKIFDLRTLAVVWVGGLFRGTIAFALIISMDISHKDEIQVTVLYLIIFSMLVYGAIMPLWTVCMTPKEEIIVNQSILEAVADGDYRHSYFTDGQVNLLMAEDYKKKRNWLHSKWRDFDTQYIKPCLINEASLKKQRRLKKHLETFASGSLMGIEIEETKQDIREDRLEDFANDTIPSAFIK